MPKNINSLIFLDFETGGLSAQTAAVTEVAAIAIKGDTLEKIDLVSTYVQPYYSDQYKYEQGALNATGITFEDMESGLPIKEVVDQLISLFAKADLYPRNKGAKPILVAHNSGFDKAFLIQIFTHCKKMKELEKLVYGKENFWGYFEPEMIDSVALAKMTWGNDEDMVNFKLGTCISKAGIDLNDAHRAINDTLALKDMCVKLIGKLRSEGATEEETTSAGRYRNHFQF